MKFVPVKNIAEMVVQLVKIALMSDQDRLLADYKKTNKQTNKKKNVSLENCFVNESATSVISVRYQSSYFCI